jgi:hypothetical protein
LIRIKDGRACATGVRSVRHRAIVNLALRGRGTTMPESTRSAVSTSLRLRRPIAAAVAALAFFAAQGAARASEPVDLELILAVDVSGSIDPEEAELQRKGYLRSLVDLDVVRAIKAGPLGKIAIIYVEWAGMGHFKTVVDWRVIDGMESAQAFAERLAAQPIETARRTSLSDAIDRSVPLFAANAYDGARRVIDISGDGANNYGRLVTAARDDAVRQGVVINGLPILTDIAGGSYPSIPDLDLFFRDCVIGGPGAFSVVARGFDDFARAVRKKLIIEIAGLLPPTEILWRAAGERADKRESPPCNIGEWRWMNIIQGGRSDR